MVNLVAVVCVVVDRLVDNVVVAVVVLFLLCCCWCVLEAVIVACNNRSIDFVVIIWS